MVSSVVHVVLYVLQDVKLNVISTVLKNVLTVVHYHVYTHVLRSVAAVLIYAIRV